jgi:hypothetical protein
MTERLGQLLDDAVGPLEPRDADPVGSILRRERTARRRATAGMTAAVLAVGAITAGGLVLNRADAERTAPLRTAGRVAGTPPVPRIVDGRMVAGTLEMQIPEDWQALDGPRKAQCDPAAGEDVVVVVNAEAGDCLVGVEVFGSGDRTVDRTGTRERNDDGTVRMTDAPPATITLPGGEPAWLGPSTRDRHPRTNQVQYRSVMVMPWSLVTYRLFADNQAYRQLIRPTRTAPISAGVLTLPETAARAYFSGSVATFSGPHATFSGPGVVGELTSDASITRLLQVLRAQTDVVENADACANASQQTAQITFLPDAQTQSYEPSDPTVFRVVISLGACQEAVSSHGGRVRISDATITELMTIFGIGAR